MSSFGINRASTLLLAGSGSGARFVGNDDNMETSQELRMLSSVTLNCQVTKNFMNSGSQLSEMQSMSQMTKVTRTAL